MYSAIILLAAVAATGSPLQSRQHYGANASVVYDFKELTPSADLTWTPCFKDFGPSFECSLLEVPLDYENEAAGTVPLAFLKKVSQNPDAEDILVNSGGPGGSGVQMVLLTSNVLESKLGTNHNFIGMDPRGVNNSGPSLSCFPDSPLNFLQQNLFFHDFLTPVDGKNEFELMEGFQRTGAYGEWCSQIYAINGTAQYVNTPAVAQDMLHYTELAAAARGQQPDQSKLSYYGISYGTFLGATFAALFPNRIERMILDGVGDLEDNYNSGWTTALYDADEAARYLFKTCYEAGPELCPFHRNASSPVDIEKRFLAIYSALKESPIATANLALGQPTTFTWQDLSQAMFGQIYQPLDKFPALAQAFADFEDGNFSTIAQADAEFLLLAPPEDNYDSRTIRSQVICNDLAGRYNLSTIEKYREHVEKQNSISFFGGPLLSAYAGTVCRNSFVYPPESQLFDGKVDVQETSAPILFVSTSIDPITPRRSAEKMHSLFPGSGLLVAEWVGHTTYFTPESCVNEYTKRYIVDKTLPGSGEVCKEREEIQNPFIAAAAGGVQKRR